MRVGIFVAKREIRMEQPAAHDPFQSQLGAFHDDELSNDARIKLERHLRDCPDCEDTLKEIAYLGEVLRESAASKMATATILDKNQISRIVKRAFAGRDARLGTPGGRSWGG